MAQMQESRNTPKFWGYLFISFQTTYVTNLVISKYPGLLLT